MTKRETALPLTMSVPQFGRLVYGYSENSAYAAAERGDIVTIKTGDTNKRPRLRVPVRVALLRVAGNDPVLLDSLVKDLCTRSKRLTPDKHDSRGNGELAARFLCWQLRQAADKPIPRRRLRFNRMWNSRHDRPNTEV